MVLRTDIDLANPGQILSDKSTLFKPQGKMTTEEEGAQQTFDEMTNQLLTEEAVAKADRERRDAVIAKTHAKKPPDYRHAHMAIIDQLLIDPTATQGKLAKETGYSRAWIAMVLQSDSFQAKLAERQAAIVDPIILSSIKARLQGAVSMSLEVMTERLESAPTMDNAISVFTAAAKASGMGQQVAQPPAVNQFIVRLPEKSLTAEEWVASNAPVLEQHRLHNASDVVLNQENEEGASVSSTASVTNPMDSVSDSIFNPTQGQEA